ncbi:hypothetical protein NDU88_006339 [Pleurodeles waltl]|uniref:Uncharacterized protein n=1 Tax=Pleurodeles waltl TaxID=8319 RepID=A0AAV7MFK4_PLEWA|nr:hypothetical protein NDU88_006339 [Pleurodeles waltl]
MRIACEMLFFVSVHHELERISHTFNFDCTTPVVRRLDRTGSQTFVIETGEADPAREYHEYVGKTRSVELKATKLLQLNRLLVMPVLEGAYKPRGCKSKRYQKSHLILER